MNCWSVVLTRTAMPPISMIKLEHSTSVVISGKGFSMDFELDLRCFADPVHPYHNPRRKIGRAHHDGDCTLRKQPSSARPNAFPVTVNRNHAAEHFVFPYGGIGVGQRIPARDDRAFIRPQDPVGK